MTSFTNDVSVGGPTTLATESTHRMAQISHRLVQVELQRSWSSTQLNVGGSYIGSCTLQPLLERQWIPRSKVLSSRSTLCSEGIRAIMDELLSSTKRRRKKKKKLYDREMGTPWLMYPSIVLLWQHFVTQKYKCKHIKVIMYICWSNLNTKTFLHSFYSIFLSFSSLLRLLMPC